MNKKIRLIELFAGYGSQAMAMRNLGLDFEHYRVCEFDKYAIASYNAVHGTNFEVSDIRNLSAADLGIVDPDKFTYLLTYSFPCTDLSIAGKREGMSRGSGTRSGLLWEVERLLKECEILPQFLLMENVPMIHSEQNIKDFAEWINFLSSIGYRNKWQDLNAKDYGIPQNRERCFLVSYLDKSFSFNFPEPVQLELTLQDLLEEKVDEKYYLSGDKVEELIAQLVDQRERERVSRLESPVKDSRSGVNDKDKAERIRETQLERTSRSGEIIIAGTMNGFECRNRVYDPSGLSPTVLARKESEIFSLERTNDEK